MSLSRPSPSRLREHQAAAREFCQAYREYLRVGPNGAAQLRQGVLDAVPAAEHALDAAGALIVIEDPPTVTTRRERHVGLAQVAFLHERSGFRTARPPLFEAVLQHVQGAIARLADIERLQRGRRRNPLYWLEQALRLLLAPAAYLVSRVAGVPLARVQHSVWAPPLRLLSVGVEVLAVLAIGRAIGWW